MSPTEFQLPGSHGTLAGWQQPGAESGPPPILALHGWLDNAASFLPLLPALAGRRVVALDLPGHGRSSHRHASHFGAFVDYVEDIARVVEGLSLGQVDLLGHSMGGALAVMYAAAFPESVRRLALLDALGPLATPASETPKAIRRGIEARLGFAERRRPYDTLEHLVALRREAGGLSEASARLIVERGTEHTGAGWRFASDPRLTLPSPLRMDEAQVRACIEAIRAPTLIVLADPATSYLDGEAARARIAAFADATVLRLAGHHHLHMESAEAQTAVAGFLAAP